jgi:hypothetical protein
MLLMLASLLQGAHPNPNDVSQQAVYPCRQLVNKDDPSL